MSGLSQILEIARRALASQQVGMNVTSHNISNANTLGYSRQRVDLAATPPAHNTLGFLGTGVTAEHIGRIRERFIDQQIRLSNSSYSDAATQQRVLSQVEAVLNEPSDSGLGSVLNKFFNAFQDLAVHPEESGSRNAVLQQGKLLAQTFNRLSTNLAQLRSDLVDDVGLKVDRINTLAEEISSLDAQITGSSAVGGDPSDAKDQRDLKIEELSKLVNINVAEDARGSVMVSVGGTVIASRSGAVSLKTMMVDDKIQLVEAGQGIAVNATGGELGGILRVSDTDIPSSLAKLDQLAATIVTRVNTLHSAGFGLGTPPPTGKNFFTGTTAADIAVDPAVLNNINNIAASGTGAPGNNEVALAIAGVANEHLLNDNTVSVTQFYASFVGEVGSTARAADDMAQSQDLILTQLENQRNAVSGVSLDEEMTNLIKFQQSYAAAARVVNTVNELFQSILDMV